MSQAAVDEAPRVAAESPRVGDRVHAPPTRRRIGRGAVRPILMLGGILAVIIGSAFYWITGGRYVSVDDAYVKAAKESIATDVSGIVMEVPVREGQHVKQGEVLLRLDPKPFKIALAGAIAARDGLLSTLDAEKLDYQRMLSEVKVKEAEVESDQANFDRYASLVKSGGVTRQEYDNARYRLMANKRALESLRVAAAVALTKLGGDPNVDSHTQNDYLQAVAKVDELQRQLDHSVIYAPFSGIVTQVDSVQPGMYLGASTAAFGLVSDERVWVEANPKETELTHVKPGDKVEITVDTYPGHVWNGRVESISPVSGSEFSVLPAQNTSGNWVKVVQRIPVRIKVDRKAGEPALRSGMSVVAEIDTGHKRTWRDLF
ncbi:HlyD family secretion protein [Rhodopila sp.]|uniref:HlyD family secretion protein n=1 Tax=Rhodopila sp. TaxID=2480087 RepID=UPI002BD14FC1|nr:HlyD family secretion protein [Rhodopila sp.]HVZ09759.1 HlyD family secretion protein [Rhodopila sp.]